MDTTEEEILPCGMERSVDIFRKLLLIRPWLPDRTLFQVRLVIQMNSYTAKVKTF
jgi:dynein heavy chain